MYMSFIEYLRVMVGHQPHHIVEPSQFLVHGDGTFGLLHCDVQPVAGGWGFAQKLTSSSNTHT